MKRYLSLIKFSHTVFALPFALVGFFVGVLERGGGIEGRLLFLVLVCMVCARSAAMAFNRWLDRDIDTLNPRTQMREIPAGIVSPAAALRLTVVASALFVAATYFINPLCFYLSPVALAIVLGYSYTKRFTAWCHHILGLGLALAPVGAYLAATGTFGWIPILYGAAVLLWTAGFDIIYALQDEAFDREQGLFSIPAKWGKERALRLSEWLHLGTAAFMVSASSLMHSRLPQAHWLTWLGTAVFLAMLVYQHRLVKPNDLSRVNAAFFTANGIASLIFGSMTVLDLVLL